MSSPGCVKKKNNLILRSRFTFALEFKPPTIIIHGVAWQATFSIIDLDLDLGLDLVLRQIYFRISKAILIID